MSGYEAIENSDGVGQIPLLSQAEIDQEMAVLAHLGAGWDNVARALRFIKEFDKRTDAQLHTWEDRQKAVAKLFQSLIFLVDALLSGSQTPMPKLILCLDLALCDVAVGTNHRLLLGGEIASDWGDRVSQRADQRIRTDSAAVMTFLVEFKLERNLSAAAEVVARELTAAGFSSQNAGKIQGGTIRRWPRQVQSNTNSATLYRSYLDFLRVAASQNASAEIVGKKALQALRPLVYDNAWTSKIR